MEHCAKSIFEAPVSWAELSFTNLHLGKHNILTLIEVLGVYFHDLVSNPATFATRGQNLRLYEPKWVHFCPVLSIWAKLASDNGKFWPSEAKVAGFDTRSSKYTPKASIKWNWYACQGVSLRIYYFLHFETVQSKKSYCEQVCHKFFLWKTGLVV